VRGTGADRTLIASRFVDPDYFTYSGITLGGDVKQLLGNRYEDPDSFYIAGIVPDQLITAQRYVDPDQIGNAALTTQWQDFFYSIYQQRFVL
jgi:hypothetical protein